MQTPDQNSIRPVYMPRDIWLFHDKGGSCKCWHAALQTTHTSSTDIKEDRRCSVLWAHTRQCAQYIPHAVLILEELIFECCLFFPKAGRVIKCWLGKPIFSLKCVKCQEAANPLEMKLGCLSRGDVTGIKTGLKGNFTHKGKFTCEHYSAFVCKQLYSVLWGRSLWK